MHRTSVFPHGFRLSGIKVLSRVGGSNRDSLFSCCSIVCCLRHGKELRGNHTLYPCSFPLTEGRDTGSQWTSARVLLWTMIWTLSGADKGTAEQREGSYLSLKPRKTTGKVTSTLTFRRLTVFSRVSSHYISFWAVAIIVQRLNLNLKGHVGWRSRHDELGSVGHSLRGPVLVHVLLSPVYFVLQTGPIGLKPCQRLNRIICCYLWKNDTF